MVLQKINITISQGETVAIVGHSGAGKSTLVDLIPRFYDVSSGSIKLDGEDIRNLILSSLRAQIGIVTQESILFNDTIRANISYGIDTSSESKIRHAAEMANAWEFIEQMDAGLDSVIGERGNNLSGGQKQRLAIARALLKDPPILIFDEATSALDAQSEYLVQEAMENLRKNRTVIVIAHRLSTIKNADKILVLMNGELAAIGTHESLLSSSPIYQNLYQLQFVSGKKNSSAKTEAIAVQYSR
jgi:subfamily B ATP-binding cassette protein MsbA